MDKDKLINRLIELQTTFANASDEAEDRRISRSDRAGEPYGQQQAYSHAHSLITQLLGEVKEMDMAAKIKVTVPRDFKGHQYCWFCMCSVEKPLPHIENSPPLKRMTILKVDRDIIPCLTFCGFCGQGYDIGWGE